MNKTQTTTSRRATAEPWSAREQREREIALEMLRPPQGWIARREEVASNTIDAWTRRARRPGWPR